MAFFTVVLLFGVVGYSFAINCHYCAGVTNPHYCAEMVKCREDEECFSDLVIGDLGNTFYNSGCRHKYVCNLIVKSIHKRNQLPVCEECCGKDACNTGLCMEPRNETTPNCYKCDSVDNPYDCHNKVRCKPDEVCITEEYLDPTTFQKKYKLGCESAKRCDLLNELGRKRDMTTCIECCPHTGCNRHLCYEGPRPSNGKTSHPGATSPTAAVVTTTQAPAAATTTQAQTGTTEKCEDSDLVDCKELDSVSNICTEVTDATRLYCAKWCGVCGSDKKGSVITTTMKTAPTTTLTTCTDSPIVNCTELDITTNICHPVTPATTLYCAGHCKLSC